MDNKDFKELLEKLIEKETTELKEKYPDSLVPLDDTVGNWREGRISGWKNALDWLQQVAWCNLRHLKNET